MLADTGAVVDYSGMEPHQCTIGSGDEIKGWEEGIPQMRRGETAIIVCPPEYAFGPEGRPPAVPPNSTLIYQI